MLKAPTQSKQKSSYSNKLVIASTLQSCRTNRILNRKWLVLRWHRQGLLGSRRWTNIEPSRSDEQNDFRPTSFTGRYRGSLGAPPPPLNLERYLFNFFWGGGDFYFICLFAHLEPHQTPKLPFITESVPETCNYVMSLNIHVCFIHINLTEFSFHLLECKLY